MMFRQGVAEYNRFAPCFLIKRDMPDKQAREILELNKSERHIRSGLAILSKKPGRILTNYNEIKQNPYHNPSDTFIHCKKVS